VRDAQRVNRANKACSIDSFCIDRTLGWCCDAV
jgi:hypothetical protein